MGVQPHCPRGVGCGRYVSAFLHHLNNIFKKKEPPIGEESCRSPVRIHGSWIYFILNSDHVTGRFLLSCCSCGLHICNLDRPPPFRLKLSLNPSCAVLMRGSSRYQLAVTVIRVRVRALWTPPPSFCCGSCFCPPLLSHPHRVKKPYPPPSHLTDLPVGGC